MLRRTTKRQVLSPIRKPYSTLDLYPPLTPASSTSSNDGQQIYLNATQNAALTPHTSCTGGTTPTVPHQQTTAIIAPLLPQSKCCKTLEEAHLYPLMLIDLEIETQWKKHVLKPVTEILDHKVQDRLGYCQELVYAAKRGLWRGKSPPKPTIVVSVATKADRDRVKKHCKKMPRLQKDIANCQLRLMVVIDPVNLQAVHSVTDPTSSSSMSTHITECTISVDGGGRCAEMISLPEPSAMTGEHTCTLGGTIVIKGKLYGLTAGHAFQLTHLDSVRRSPSVYSASDCSAKTWLEDPQNPFVFPNDGDVGEGELTDTCTRDGSTSPTMSVASSKAYFPEALHPSIDDNASEDRNAIRARIISPLAPTVNPDHPKRIVRNCDWAIVELPRAVRTRQNAYQRVDSHAIFDVTRMAQETDRICGDVEVKLSHSTVARGCLSPNSTYYGVGPFLFDVRLVVLQRPLRK